MEIALTILVLSVGLLALFGLLPTGLQMNKQAIDETQAALFAEEVLNGIRAQAAVTRWDRIRTAISLPPVAPHVFEEPDNLWIEPTGGGWERLRYVVSGVREGDAYLDYGIRYRLEILDVDARRKVVRLSVRPGEFGPDEPTYNFYTELYNYGQPFTY